MFKMLIISALTVSSGQALANKCESKVERDFTAYLKSEPNLESKGVNPIDKMDARYAIETSEELVFDEKEKANLLKLISKKGVWTYDGVASDGPGSVFFLIVADASSCKTIKTIHISNE